MRAEFIELDVATANATDGDDEPVELYKNKWVQIFGTFVASLDIEVSLNGSDFVKVHTGITAPGLFEVTHTCARVLIHTATFTSGTPQAILGGLNTRSD